MLFILRVYTTSILTKSIRKRSVPCHNIIKRIKTPFRLFIG
jgi:hypothetical protein